MPNALAVSVRAVLKPDARMSTRLRTWNERLNWALRERGVTKAELARACGIERASVTEWTNGKTKDPKLAPFFLACDTLRLEPRWLALGEGPIEPQGVDQRNRESILETVTRLADRLSAAEQKRVLNILQERV
jgi:transcriptional regulator with XRE-family HTH domain